MEAENKDNVERGQERDKKKIYIRGRGTKKKKECFMVGEGQPGVIKKEWVTR